MIEAIEAQRDEFYVGYEPRMPTGIARRVSWAVGLFACAAGVAASISVAAQQRLPPSRFEFGVVKPVAGILRRDPYPSLQANGRRVWLVGPGKSGADTVLSATPDGAVTLRGSAIGRGPHRMLEVVPPGAGSASPLPVGVQSSDRERQFGVVTLTGEIVDSKCFLGVMNPGEGAVHRDCARRCLSGGIPPMLLVRNDEGLEELVLLLSATGERTGEKFARVAGQPITVTGRLAREGNAWMLYVGAHRAQ